MAYPQGAIVTGADPFGNSPTRPYLILSNGRHPFHGNEYIGCVVTTTARQQAVELDDEAFTRGGLPKQSYVSPWNPLTLKDGMIDKHVATVSDALVEDVVDELNYYVQLP